MIIGSTKRKFCSHCGDYVSKSTYHRHRQEEIRNARFRKKANSPFTEFSDDEELISSLSRSVQEKQAALLYQGNSDEQGMVYCR
jgi:hypothetical protein